MESMQTSLRILQEIKTDLGSDINSLGISDATIVLKINEALRKISSYAPLVVTEAFPVSGKKVEMPKSTMTVTKVYSIDPISSSAARTYENDIDLFSYSRYLYNHNDVSDPYIFLMRKNEASTLQSFVSISDWRYEKSTNTLYLSNFAKPQVCVKYLRQYTSLDEIEDLDILQYVKEYALALCKIIEGNIRRKLQSAPGAIAMDGDALVSEGNSEKQRLDDLIPRIFSHLRFGIRV